MHDSGGSTVKGGFMKQNSQANSKVKSSSRFQKNALNTVSIAMRPLTDAGNRMLKLNKEFIAAGLTAPRSNEKK